MHSEPGKAVTNAFIQVNNSIRSIKSPCRLHSAFVSQRLLLDPLLGLCASWPGGVYYLLPKGNVALLKEIIRFPKEILALSKEIIHSP